MITAGSSVRPLTGLLLANINWYFIPKHLDLSLSCIDWVSLKLPEVILSEKAPVPSSISRNLLFSSQYLLTHLVDDGPCVLLGDGGGEAAEYLVEGEASLLVQVTSSPWGRGRGWWPARVSLNTAHDADVTSADQGACHSNGNVPTKFLNWISICCCPFLCSGIPDKQLSLIVWTTPKPLSVHFE